MGVEKFNPTKPNNEIGFFIGKSRRVIIGTPFGERANWIQAGTGGDLIWKNLETDETNIIIIETGQILPLACDVILPSANIDGQEETTGASNLFWGTTPDHLGRRP